MMNNANKINFTIPVPQQDVDYSSAERSAYFSRITALLQEKDAALVTHYYTSADVQLLTEQTGGFIGDSLAMAEFGYRHAARTLVVCGVRFMGETAKILSPEKTIIMPTLEATCSLDLGCPAEPFAAFRAEHPDRVVVVYANTSADIKAQADWVVTSSNALAIVSHLHEQGKRILWGPDRHLGRYIQAQTGADMVLWQGACIVHDEFKAKGLADLKAIYPEAAILVHPESPENVVAMADVVGSTSALLKASQTLPHSTFIVATDRGIFYKMKQVSPDKTFIAAPTAGEGATCHSCAHCPWMAMNQLPVLEQALRAETGIIELDEAVMTAARTSLQRMLSFTA